MFTRDPENHLDNFCFRLPAAMKREIQRRAAERSGVAGRTISPGEIVREILERALEHKVDETPTSEQELHDEVGQSLTAVLLDLKHGIDLSPTEVRPVLEGARATGVVLMSLRPTAEVPISTSLPDIMSGATFCSSTLTAGT